MAELDLNSIIATAGDRVSAKLAVSTDNGQRNRSADVRSEKDTESEIPAEFVALLDETRKEFITLIENIQTSESYAQFREKMVITKDGEPTDIRFFPLEEIKDSLRRVLADDEVTMVRDLKAELEQATQKRLYELVHADLSAQFDREQTAIDAVENEKDLDLLAKEIVQEKSRVTLTLSDVVLERIPARERIIDQEIVDTEYRKCMKALKNAIQKKREVLLKPLQDVKDSIAQSCREKESSARVLFQSLSKEEQKSQKENYRKFLDYLQSLWQGAENAFNPRDNKNRNRDIDELNRTLRAANEAQFVVKERGKKDVQSVAPEKKKEYSDEELFSTLVEYFKKKKLPFTFSNPKNGEKLVIISVSDEKIKYHQNEDNKTLGTSSKQVKPFLQILDNNFDWKPRMPRGVERASSLIAEPVVETGTSEEIIPDVDTSDSGNQDVSVDEPTAVLTTNENHLDQGIPAEESHDSEEEPEQTEEEKRYESLESLLEYTKYWSIFGVVADTLVIVIVSTYSRKTGKSRKDIIDEMGGMDLVAEKILMKAIQKVLPSEWSEDDKKFYSRESALDFLEVFVEEDEAKTEK